MDLAEIQHAIEALPKDQQTALSTWLASREEEDWDVEMALDFAPGGPGTAILDEMKADALAGRFHPFEQGPPGGL